MISYIILICIIHTVANCYPSVQTMPMKSNGSGRNQVAAGSSTRSWKNLNTIAEVVNSDPRLMELREVLDKSELGHKLNQSRDITVLLPSNGAVRSYLKPMSNFMSFDEIMDIMKGHVIPNVVKVSELIPGENIVEKTMVGTSVQFEDSSFGNGLVKDPVTKEIVARILAEIETSNGVVYIIDRVLLDEIVKNKLSTLTATINQGSLKNSNFQLPSAPEYPSNPQFKQYNLFGNNPKLSDSQELYKLVS